MKRYQKNIRHTTHIEAPSSVTITRPHHPLNGKQLKVFGQAHRNGILYLILILPDDSHAYIPLAWTNLQAEQKNNPTSSIIASCDDLMRARFVIDSGECVLGPCSGQSLKQLPIVEKDGDLLLEEI